jgi:hypothetical protein
MDVELPGDLLSVNEKYLLFSCHIVLTVQITIGVGIQISPESQAVRTEVKDSTHQGVSSRKLA